MVIMMIDNHGWWLLMVRFHLTSYLQGTYGRIDWLIHSFVNEKLLRVTDFRARSLITREPHVWTCFLNFDLILVCECISINKGLLAAYLPLLLWLSVKSKVFKIYAFKPVQKTHKRHSKPPKTPNKTKQNKTKHDPNYIHHTTAKWPQQPMKNSRWNPLWVLRSWNTSRGPPSRRTRRHSSPLAREA